MEDREWIENTLVGLVRKLPQMTGLKIPTDFWIMPSVCLIYLKMKPLSVLVLGVGIVLGIKGLQ